MHTSYIGLCCEDDCACICTIYGACGRRQIFTVQRLVCFCPAKYVMCDFCSKFYTQHQNIVEAAQCGACDARLIHA